MRQNLPVTDHGTPVVEDPAVVSKTDKDGNIVHLHSYFREVSGYGAEELIGAPRDIIGRRPDMAGAARPRPHI